MINDLKTTSKTLQAMLSSCEEILPNIIDENYKSYTEQFIEATKIVLKQVEALIEDSEEANV
jgi:hypothetical protein